MSNVVDLSILYVADPSIGRPVSSGSIYVGIVDLDPKIEGNRKQISVLQENGTTVEVSQPISTSSGGVPLYNGSPVTILVEGSYSLRIDDSTGSQVYYVPQNDIEDSPFTPSVETISDIREITETPNNGDIVSITGYYSATENQDWRYSWDSSSVEADNGGTIIKVTAIATGRWIRLKQDGIMPFEAWGAVGDGVTDDYSSFLSWLNSDVEEIIIDSSKTYKIDSMITMLSNKKITVKGSGKAIFDINGVLETEYFGITGDGLTNISIDGLYIKGSITELSTDGFARYCLRFDNSTNIHMDNCGAEGGDFGLMFGDSVFDSSITNSVAFNCWNNGIGTRATVGNAAKRLTFDNITTYTDKGLVDEALIAGFRFEETYDSEANNIKAYNCVTGFRCENSCDNRFSNILTYDNFKSGGTVYIRSERNVITNVTSFDNNRSNQDAVDLISRGNDNTSFSGFDISFSGNNNIISNITTYQTLATTVPFTSGSEEPIFGSKIEGVTSGSTGRVRAIELTSGTWAGGDAAGVLHIVDASDAFSAAEQINNITTVLPYNSGSEKPGETNIIEGAVSGATGELLWPSQQGGNIDWAQGNSEGFLYLINVTGTFNGTEILNNTTRSESGFSTSSAAITAPISDICTTNGATTLGTSKGFQKYGFTINPTNKTPISDACTYNIVNGVQSFNNDLEQINDRGLYNSIVNKMTFNTGVINRGE